MVTIRVATLILMALVECGGCQFHMRINDAPEEQAGPPIDPNPYRFIGGQRYGEGWPVKCYVETDQCAGLPDATNCLQTAINHCSPIRLMKPGVIYDIR